MENLEPDNNYVAPLPDHNVVIKEDESLSQPSPDNPPWKSGVAVGMWALSVIFIMFVPGFGVGLYLAIVKLFLNPSLEFTPNVLADPTVILINIIGVIPAHLLTLALAWLIVTNRNKFSFFRTLGWKWGGFNVLHSIAVVIGFFLLAALLSSYIPEQDNDFLKILRSSRAAVFVIAFMATFTAPLVEEVIHRGILYSAFQRSVGKTWAVVIVTTMFAGIHVYQYFPNILSISLIFLLSFILTMVRARTGNLLPCIVLHTVFNGAQSLLLIFEPYIENFVKQSTEKAAFFF